MSFLAELLGENEPKFSVDLEYLAKKSLKPNVDLKLINELRKRSLLMLKQLGLDPHDTTLEELFMALNSFYAINKSSDNKFWVENQLGFLLIDHELVSSNYFDVRDNFEKKLSFGDRSVIYFRRLLYKKISDLYGGGT
ncbi:MAG: hypothetical protein LBE03_02110 [Candidatus Nomurabacteria bacterium]|jgi:hypothetical protein|nr:hypothetical protein [Candidatus Nomurabacteria bacterium]